MIQFRYFYFRRPQGLEELEDEAEEEVEEEDKEDDDEKGASRGEKCRAGLCRSSVGLDPVSFWGILRLSCL